MKNSFKVPLFCSILCIFGCQNQENKDIIVNKFPVTISLVGNPVEEIGIFSRGNVNLCVVDTFLVVQKREENFIHIYSTNTHKLLGKTGTEGNGPGEFIMPELTKQVKYDKTSMSPVVYVHDLPRNRLTEINIFNTINNPGHINTQEELPNVNTFLIRFFYKNDSSFIAAPEEGGRFIHYNYRTSKAQIKPYLPETKFSIRKSILSNAYRSACCFNEEKGLIASAPIMLGEIDFFDFNGNYINSTIFEPTDDLEKELSKDQKSINPKFQIADIESKGNLIYGLNYNNRTQDLYPTKEITNLKVQVFDWEGQPIKEYLLDHRFISSFAVDLSHNRIYGYCPDEKDHTIIVYEFEQ